MAAKHKKKDQERLKYNYEKRRKQKNEQLQNIEGRQSLKIAS